MIRRLPSGPGGWHSLHHDLDDSAVDAPGDVRVLASVIHSSDWHICDVASSARLEYLDRYYDPDHPARLVVGPVGTYRPQEFLTRHVADESIRTFNKVESGPQWGRPIDAVVLTGDLLDNAQSNELSDLVTLLGGGEIEALDIHQWVGAEGAQWDDHYWHPEARRDDRPRSLFGFPTVPGLLDIAARRFQTPGLVHRFVGVHGNHDALLQGTVAVDRELAQLLASGQRITGIAPGTTPAEIAVALAQVGPARYIHTDSFPRETLSGGRSTKFLGVGDFRTVLGGLAGSLGDDTPEGTRYFTARVGEVIVVSLDTVNPHGGYHGSLDAHQLEWLREVLHRHQDDHVVLASHHPPRTLVNDYAPEGETRRVLAREVLDVALGAENVMVWLTGHEHENFVTFHSDGKGRVIPEIGTSSLIDWPQQSRIVELGIDGRGNRVISSRMVDHDSPVMPPLDLEETGALASWSRLLAANDYQRRDPITSLDRAEGFCADRDFVWKLPPAGNS